LRGSPTVKHSSGAGRYEFDLNTAHTLDTQLNVFADFKPKLSDESKRARMVFLGNIQPELQREVREQVRGAELVALDTMNYWISSKHEALERILREVDLAIINEAEVRQFTGEANLVKGCRQILALGPRHAGRQAGRVRRADDHQGRDLRGARLSPRERLRSHRRRATPSPAASSATSPRARRSTTASCAAPSSSAASWRRSPSRSFRSTVCAKFH